MSDRFQAVRYLGFDVFGTVVDWRSGVTRAVAPFLRRHSIDADPAAFADDWRSLYQPALQAVRSGARPWVKLEVLHRENLEIVLSRHGADFGTIGDDELTDLNRSWNRLDPWPDSIAGLTRLKRRFAIGTISNGSIAGMVNLARFASLPWDVITGAEIAHSYKPTPRTYLASAAALDLEPAQVCMVAAHNDDLRAARAAGLRTVFVRRPREHGPDQSTDLHADDQWDVIAESVEEVADLLGCP